MSTKRFALIVQVVVITLSIAFIVINVWPRLYRQLVACPQSSNHYTLSGDNFGWPATIYQTVSGHNDSCVLDTDATPGSHTFNFFAIAADVAVLALFMTLCGIAWDWHSKSKV
ncbi:MAG TPA: hypothetical protein VMR95_04625 [Candidatus Binatia bacterium]|nr:hypothetical protein [Candidatus Binatia bacterium]